jgi:hypothetical protein
MTQPSKVCPLLPYEVDEEIVDMQKADMTSEEFAMENLARFPDESSGFFSSMLIDKISPGPNSTQVVEIVTKGTLHNPYYMGVDVGRVVDGSNFVAVVGCYESGVLKVVNMVALNGGTYQQMVHEIRRLTIDFNITGIAIGQGGGGLTMKDLLAVPYDDAKTGRIYPPLTDLEDEVHRLILGGMPIVHMVKETQELNNFMYATLKSDMENGSFMMPATAFRDPDLPVNLDKIYQEVRKTKTEFLVIESVPTATGFRFIVPEGYEKDRATACVLMNYLVTEKGKEPIRSEPKLAKGFWVNV